MKNTSLPSIISINRSSHPNTVKSNSWWLKTSNSPTPTLFSLTHIDIWPYRFLACAMSLVSWRVVWIEDGECKEQKESFPFVLFPLPFLCAFLQQTEHLRLPSQYVYRKRFISPGWTFSIVFAVQILTRLLLSWHFRTKSRILNTSPAHSFPECGKDFGGPMFLWRR